MCECLQKQATFNLPNKILETNVNDLFDKIMRTKGQREKILINLSI